MIDTRRAVALLAAQAFVFGLSESLLLITANAIFLAAYGSKWLPLTYVGIAVFGTLLAASIARLLRRRPLPRVAMAAEAGVALLYVAAWAVLAGPGGVWVSAPLLVLFPILLQIGFVFVGGQAGRLLDVQELKALFPRIVSGFAVGFLAGGVLGVPLLSVLGSAKELLIVAAVSQASFVLLLAATARRFGSRLGEIEAPPAGVPRPPLHRLLSGRFVLLLMGYQVFSAAGTYLVEYVLFDRAASRYATADSLARFLSRFTIALNLVDILFLALLAGVLLRRFGLRLGVAANPAVVMLLVAAMLASTFGAGAGSLALFALVAAARIADVSLTDGTTRTALNTAFQVLPVEDRLALQSLVEGVGLPLAIGATGVVLFALRAAGTPFAAIVAVTLAVCVAWTASALLLYRDYARALVAALRRRLLPEVDVDDAAYLRRLLASDEGRDMRLALDLMPATRDETERAELERVAANAPPDVRLQALRRLAEAGDRDASARLAATMRTLLRDPDPAARAAALAAIGPTDADLVDEAVAALEVPATVGAASAALVCLGDAILPKVAAALAAAEEPVPPATLRLVRAARGTSSAEAVACLGPYVGHPNRELGLAVLSALAAAGADPVPVADRLEQTLRADAEHAARCLALLAAGERGAILERALCDELDLLRERVLALLAVRYGAEPMRAVELGLASGADGRRGLALETLEVTLSRADAAQTLPLLQTDLPAAERLERLERLGPPAPAPAVELADLVDDPHGHWRSAWLRQCALHEAASA